VAIPPQVGIVGMAALRRDINKQCEDERSALYTAIKAAGKAAVEPVAIAVRERLPVSEHRTRTSGLLLSTVRTAGTKTGGNVRMGSAKVNWAGPVDFGGYPRPAGASWRHGAFRDRTTGRETGGGRPFLRDGRYLFPAARDRASIAAGLYADAVDHILNTPSTWTNSGTDPGSVHD